MGEMFAFFQRCMIHDERVRDARDIGRSVDHYLQFTSYMGFAGYFTMEMLNLCTHCQYKGDLSFSTDAYQPTRIHPRLEAQVGPDTRQIDHSDHLS